jgi:uncharacterized protein YkwD
MNCRNPHSRLQVLLTLTVLLALSACGSAQVREDAPEVGRPHGYRRVWVTPPSQDGPQEATELLERRMAQLIDQARASPAYQAETKGRALPLVWDPVLAHVARAHAADMARRGYFDHITPDGATLQNRIEGGGLAWRRISENIAKTFSIESAHQLFLDEPAFEPNHRANILDREVTHVGVGIVRAAEGYLYIVEDFRLP